MPGDAGRTPAGREAAWAPSPRDGVGVVRQPTADGRQAREAAGAAPAELPTALVAVAVAIAACDSALLLS
ncbi:hypothetical protein GCM10027028_57860 [Streptomyces sundarbansensis]